MEEVWGGLHVIKAAADQESWGQDGSGASILPYTTQVAAAKAGTDYTGQWLLLGICMEREGLSQQLL